MSTFPVNTNYVSWRLYCRQINILTIVNTNAFMRGSSEATLFLYECQTKPQMF